MRPGYDVCLGPPVQKMTEMAGADDHTSKEGSCHGRYGDMLICFCHPRLNIWLVIIPGGIA